MRLAGRSLPGPVIVALCAGCGLLGPAGAPDRLASDVPGPFVEQGPIALCIGATRLDAPAGTGPDATGLCVPEGLGPVPCSTDAGCAERERCVCGLCRVPVCLSGADCPEGFDCMGHDRRCQRRCTVDGDCPEGQRCDPTTLGCTPACEVDADCAHGEVCSVSRRLCVTQVCTGPECSATRTCDVQRRTALAASWR